MRQEASERQEWRGKRQLNRSDFCLSLRTLVMDAPLRRCLCQQECVVIRVATFAQLCRKFPSATDVRITIPLFVL
jgi:hypothetical protein